MECKGQMERDKPRFTVILKAVKRVNTVVNEISEG